MEPAMYRLMRILLIASTIAAVSAQSQSIIGAEPQVIPLWAGEVPGALGNSPADRPFVTYYPPAPAGIATGTAIIIAPGGGYQSLAVTHEGVQEANWFNAMGIAAFVLQYRLGPRYHHPTELGDAQRA